MIEIAIIVGSTRPGRKADAVAKWVHDIASQRLDALRSGCCRIPIRAFI
jgi:hypothetical protein